MAVLSFDGCVTLAVRIVAKQYPDARLCEATGKASGGLTTNPVEIDRLQVVFSNSDNTTVIINETRRGEFGKPHLIDQPWLEDVAIQWPVKMRLEQAHKLKEQAGYKHPYSTVTLRNPFSLTLSNPYFIFGGNPDAPYILVDTVFGKIHTVGYKTA